MGVESRVKEMRKSAAVPIRTIFYKDEVASAVASEEAEDVFEEDERGLLGFEAV